MKTPFIPSAIAGLLLLATPLACAAQADDRPAGLAVPQGLSPCAPDDPVAAAEVRVAASMGGQFLNCFHGQSRLSVPGAAELGPDPGEYAFSMRVAGGGYTSASLDQLLSVVKAQWKSFQPLSTEFHDRYIARLNALINGPGPAPSTLASIKPVLVSIDRLDPMSYTVISIRSYVFNEKGGQAATTNVSAAGLVLRDGNLIRLTMQRMLTSTADVAELRAEIAAWTRATEGANP